jgi:tetratricopeptide (TPR) repeat protein
MTSDNARLTESVDGEFSAGPAPEVLEPGSLIAGRYEIRRVLGSGGYAIVYLAHDCRLNSEVALKVMRADRNSPAALTRFRREVNIAREAASPRLVRVYDIGIDGDLWYLMMEVVRGESLRERMRRGPLAIAEAIEITKEILEGLAALHALKVVHRDLKPENILLDADGVPKLADFGLARFIDEEHARTTVTGAVIGTTDYLSPEQALGRPIDARSDLYALGVVLFEMLTGRLPFEGESSLGSVIARLRAPAPSARKYRRDIPIWLASIIARLLSKEPGRRFAGANDVLVAIRRRKVDFRIFASPRRIALSAAVVALACAGVLFAPTATTSSQFLRIDPDSTRGIVALGQRGETLWKIAGIPPDTKYVLARVENGRPPVVAAVLIRGGDCLPGDRQTLSLIEPETGRTLRQIELPSAGTDFPAYTDRFGVLSMAAEDIDGDGVDEILVTYNHIPEAPSYIVLYEPRLNRARVIFEGMGHHRFALAADLDGDGRKELLISGINNGINWYNAMAAIRLTPPVGDPTPEDKVTSSGPLRSPDMFNRSDAGLLWYTLLPRGLKPTALSDYVMDAKRRLITLKYENRAPVTISYDGFLQSVPSTSSPAQREQSRRQAWLAFGKTRQLLAEHFSAESVAESANAIASAQKAGDPILAEVMRCLHAKTLVEAGRATEAQLEFQSLVASSENAMELAYDAGRAFHLHGDIDRAVEWYRRGLAAGSETSIGKNKAEFIQAITFALVERAEWNRALDEISNFQHVFAPLAADAQWYREFVHWRSGTSPHLGDLIALWNATDVRCYWSLEFRNANAADAMSLLPDVDREISWHAEPLGPLWSLKAELLARTGKPKEAADAARRAWEITSADANTNLIARGHLSLVHERLVRYAGK